MHLNRKISLLSSTLSSLAKYSRTAASLTTPLYFSLSKLGDL